ncbi:hypothetical protein ACQP2F_32960 [Actinoplanes sp. CA-030573]|uniref:hypothetical protein n=1 Tax=Actinoplanes sp. CA-030573 TaxID=3239898 RepID=UPI003D8E5CBE
MTSVAFAAGSTVVRRDVLDGRVWTAAAYRLLSDDGHELNLVCWPGCPSYVPTTWIAWLHGGDDATRKQGIPNLANRRWQLGAWTWQHTIQLSWIGLDPEFSAMYFRPLAGGPAQWKINFERPVQRTKFGIDTFDLLLDLAGDATGERWTWKDEDEYQQARRLGLITDSEHQRIDQARQRATAFVEARTDPLAHDWSAWDVPEDWLVPVLPAHVTDVVDRGRDSS